MAFLLTKAKGVCLPARQQLRHIVLYLLTCVYTHACYDAPASSCPAGENAPGALEVAAAAAVRDLMAAAAAAIAADGEEGEADEDYCPAPQEIDLVGSDDEEQGEEGDALAELDDVDDSEDDPEALLKTTVRILVPSWQ